MATAEFKIQKNCMHFDISDENESLNLSPSSSAKNIPFFVQIYSMQMSEISPNSVQR